MSEDESEPRYFRCPECRSLIPESSTRCRMCGVAVVDPFGSGLPQLRPATQSVAGSQSVKAASVWLAYFLSDGPHDLN
ncbi:MAG TPA: hypothetical protein VFI05_04625 [Nitrospiraceae bacterium]|nr:hypothetical protein [Nitrospiraceae bacterium]